MKNKIRYVLVESTFDIVNESLFWRSLSRELIRCIGELNYHKVNPKLMGLINSKNFVVRAELKGINMLILSLALIKNIDNKEVAFYTLKTSGTLKALMKATKQKAD
ncbi:MAG: Rpp14/Pop5 family protein [Candidatus Micrarchaeia archaeon]